MVSSLRDLVSFLLVVRVLYVHNFEYFKSAGQRKCVNRPLSESFFEESGLKRKTMSDDEIWLFIFVLETNCQSTVECLQLLRLRMT